MSVEIVRDRFASLFYDMNPGDGLPRWEVLSPYGRGLRTCR